MNFLENGKNAYIVEPGNRQQLKDAIVNSMLNPRESKSIGLAGSECAKTNFYYTSQYKLISNFLHQ